MDDPEIQQLIQELLSALPKVLGDAFQGLLIGGSLALGGFNPQTSDIDFVVITARELPDDILPALSAMHARLRNSGQYWARRMECSYLPWEFLRAYSPSHAWQPALSVEGEFRRSYHGPDWVLQLHILREHGIALSGPDPKTLIEPAAPEALREAARATLHAWWEPQLGDFRLLDSPEYQAYAILTMARSRYTLQHGSVAPKPVAARWAQENLGPPWPDLIAQALSWEPGKPLDLKQPALDLIRQTLTYADRLGDVWLFPVEE